MKALYKNELGCFEELEIFLYYDGPQLFSCKSMTGQIYICYFANFDAANIYWIYIPVSSERYTLIENGEVTIIKAIIEVEDDWVWLLKIPVDGSSTSIKRIKGREVEPGFLPRKDMVIEQFEEEACNEEKYPLTASQAKSDEIQARMRLVKEQKQLLPIRKIS